MQYKKTSKNKALNLIIIASAWLILFFSGSAAFAEGFVPDTETGIAGQKCTSPNGCGDYSLNDMVSVAAIVSNWILGIVGSVALLFFIYGGFVFIFSGGSEQKVTQGKQILINSIIGLVIVFTSFLIIQFSIEALTGKKHTGESLNVNADFK
jgi:hypothetical protein